MSYWIIVVDDDALSLMNAKNLLSSDDIRVSCLRSGGDLVKFMEKNSPDLILLDILMPEMDGFETFHALRTQEENLGRVKTPIIFMTGENGTETERRGLKAGASDFIRKPFNQDVLLSRVYNTINNSKAIESLTEEATLDKLTGFLNKSSGTVKIANLCLKEEGSLMILDLDNFKLVNDLYGHDMGDKVLESFAQIIRRCTRTEDLTCRIGGDEFLTFFCNLKDKNSVEALSTRLNDQLSEECRKLMGNSFNIPIGISIGAVMIPENGTDYHHVFNCADAALYKVKQNGKHGYEIYSPMIIGTDVECNEENLRKELKSITHVVEERGDGTGAQILGLDAFISSYRYIMRHVKRYRENVTNILFSLIPQNKEDDISDIVTEFGHILQEVLRRSDIILHSKPNQFFLMLPGLNSENTNIVTDRILKKWANMEKCDIKWITTDPQKEIL